MSTREPSGPVAVNIGHGNKNVLDAMKRQMDKATFAYRLHFENEPAEERFYQRPLDGQIL